jgi:general secretion pathway protein D
MKKIKQSMQAKRGATGWQRVMAAMLLSGLMMAHPVEAQDPASNQATLNFADADIESVIKAIGHYTNTTFLIDPRVKGTITVVSEKPLTKKQAFELLTSTLRMQGYAVVMSDGFAKVVPEADAKLQAGPIKAERIRGDQIATQIFRLRHESAAGLVPVLRPLISPNNTINAYPGNNALVITDYADNLRRLERIINSLDRPLDSEVEIIPVEHAAASDLVGIISRLMSETPAPATPTRGNAAAQAGSTAGAADVMVDPRTNSIIVRGASPSYIKKARSLIQRLDQPTSRPGNVHVVHLRNAQATQLAQTLRAIVAGETATPGGTQQTQGLQNSQGSSGANTTGGLQSQPSSSMQQQQQQQRPLPTGGPGGFIQADPTTNTLIITASEPVYRNLRAVIDQLDSRRAQVYVESLIVEVSASRAAEFGVQWAGLSGDSGSSYRVGTLTGFGQGGNNLINQAVSSAVNGTPLPPGNGLNFGIFRQVNGQLTLGALARALETEDDANILSMPNLITLDNEEARIIVGQNVPFITGQFTTPASGGGTAGVNPFQTIEREDIGLSLRVRPQISEGGTVKMAIYQETSSIQDTTASGLITSKRSIETNVLVDDGQIIVLGGLIDDTLQDGVEKVPGLGDIPILGNLFKYQRRSRVKTNLMVFLRPTVIRTPGRSSAVTTDRYDYIRNAGIISQSNPPGVLPDMGPLLLPPMINGQITEPPLLQVNLNRLGAVPHEATPLPPAEGQLHEWSTPASPAPIPSAEPSMDLRAPQ